MKFKNILVLIFILGCYGFVSEMDYQDALRAEEIRTNGNP